jgi:hypothetical protein
VSVKNTIIIASGVSSSTIGILAFMDSDMQILMAVGKLTPLSES